MASEFETLITSTVLPVFESLFAEAAGQAVGSGVYREKGRADQTFFYLMGKIRDREAESAEGERIKEQTLEIQITSVLAAKPRLNATVIIDDVTWAVKEVHGGTGVTRLVLSKGPIMEHSRRDYRMKR